jgi:hypothetical protein
MRIALLPTAVSPQSNRFFGCPVFVDQLSAAALVGQTDFSKIETPVYPERQAWLNSLAYCQFNEKELIDGTLWRMIR